MLEIIYRIYEVADEKTAEENLQRDMDFGMYTSTSQALNNELLMDCMLCDDREQFKNIVRDTYGKDISFKYSKKLNVGDLYCIIIGEHCYNTERYFNKIKFACDCCGASVETYFSRPICFSNSEIKYDFFNIQDYLNKRFCSNRCKNEYQEKELLKLRPNEEQEFYIQRDMFTEDISGYIYKISKKSTGEFYIGQTQYAPVFRWGQHLKTERFHIENILDYNFETIEIVPKGENILEREKYWIQKLYSEMPDKSLNISNTANIKSAQAQITELKDV